jgi:predicted TIM-barrel fold metal-dependent hydrolase
MADVATFIDLFDGWDTTMFASDWPHHDFDHPSKLDQVPMTAEQRRMVFGENALRFFNIDARGRRLAL